MHHSLISFPTTSLPLFIITFFIALFHPPVYAQFQPVPVREPCSTFVEGQALYVLGGYMNGFRGTNQSFMLDLSVSWNAANPIFKKLPDAITTTSACTMTSNGEILSASGSFKLYNVKSGPKTWTQIPKSPIGMYKSVTTDPESGLIYAIDTPVDLANYTGELIVANLKTMTFKTSSLPVMNMGFSAWVAWSSHLRSLLVYSRDSMFIYTPSNVNNSSHGWKELNTVGTKPSGGIYFCFMPAYNGSKMVIFSYRGYGDMYILDVATLTWTHYPGAQGVDSACGVSGDQVIIWGGNFLGGVLGKTNIYNMKTDTWTNVYISLSENPTSTATTGLQTPTQHSSSTTPNSDDASPSLSKENYINIAITAGVIVVAAVVALYMYIGYRIRRISGTKNCTHGSVSDLQRVDKELLEESHRLRDPTCISPDPRGKIADQEARLQQGSFGARENPEHPHAVVKEPFGARGNLEHPHAVVKEPFGARENPEHPHAVVKEPFGARGNLEHPHAVVKGSSSAGCNPKHPHAVVKGSVGGYKG